MLRLQTLGGLSLHSETHELGGAARQRRRLAILAALAASGDRGLTRDKLLALLWIDVDEAKGRQALSQSLYALRRDTFSDDLVVGSDTLRLNPNVIGSDIADFDAAIADRRYEDAAALYAGPFLDGVHLPDAEEFERWADITRMRHARNAERAMEELAARAESVGDYLAAAGWWRRLVAIDPLKTRANIGLISMLASSGERVNAVRHLEAYTERVRSELDAEPGPEVRALGERLRREPHDGTVGGRYTIERELGRGGMATVFLARDGKHDRAVAVKMLHPEYAAALGRERLEREILVTARMQHPHILPLHDSGEHGGTLYYVMPFVDGESLRARLMREQQLAVGDAVRIAREIADALDHAHRHGVVHRDIKPDNVLLADGHAVVADFGIARLVSAALDSGGTQQGMALGTPAYMSPEQIAGGEEVGPASDLFSLGCVLFEMLAGRPPWIASNARALMAQRFTTPAPRLRSLRADVPASIDDLVHQLLASDPASRIASAAELVILLGDAPRRVASRLPAAPADFVGRARETAAAVSLLTSGDVRLLTFTGAGGTGKTRLALQVASICEPHFDSACFVDLSVVSDAAAVDATIADALDVRTVEGVDLFAALTAAIGTARLLVVLDNFEQVVGAAPLVARLLAACHNLSVLVTSRSRLDVRGEHEFFVAPLAVLPDGTDAELAPAVELFVRRAQSAQPGFIPDAQAIQTIAAICARIDGLPLAIELAAARCRVMSPAVMLARLESGFELLASGARDMPARHQTMRRTIEWSFGLLDAAHQDLLARMAVFAGGCTLTAVEQVCADDTLAIDVLEGVGTLLDASLLMSDPAPDGGGEPRLRMLETVREFALQRLRLTPDLAARVFDRHSAWALSYVSALAPQLTSATQRAALAALAREHPNLAAAFTRMVAAGDARFALTFVAATWRFWLVRRSLSEGRELVERALGIAAQPGTDALRADALLAAGQLAQNSGDIAVASRHFAEALGIRRQLGDTRGETRALADLGWVNWRRCDYAEARRLSNECLALARGMGDEGLQALALGNLGFIEHCEGNLNEARHAFEEAITLRDRLADRRGVAFMRSAMAWTMLRGGQLDDARVLLEHAVVVHREIGDERLEAFSLNIMAEVALRGGDISGARALLARTLPTLRRIGDRWALAQALCALARVELHEGNLRDARECVTESLSLRRQIDDRFGEAESLATNADILHAEDRIGEATDAMRASHDLRAAIGDRLGNGELRQRVSAATP
ncbi:MAG: hypothetical protein JWL61_1851 [Gemmatimonadetes bacterium]|nr:hypothetical protein [Gemmatimonadota bacterium]